jgi:hypothetical protein
MKNGDKSMKIRKPGYILLGLGIFIIVFAFALDAIGIGKKGIQAAQLLIIQCGVLLSVISIGIFNLPEFELKAFTSVKKIIARILSLPAFTWVLLGFLLTYILLFIAPVFFSPDRGIHYLTRYLPEIKPIGRDLGFNTGSIRNWLSGNGLYDLENQYYPPLYAVVFSPFLLLEYPDTYFVMTSITLFSVVVSSLILPLLVVKNEDRTILFFFFLTGIFSYGMQFELERGQFNVFAFTLSFLAIYIFHRHYQFRHFAYLLLSVSIQIKLYPAIFVLMFVKDWKDWRNNLLRFAGLGIFNIALLFVLGYQVFIDFIKAIPTLLNSVWVRPYNHSLASFVNDLTSNGLGIFQPNTVAMLKDYSSLIKITLTLYFLICLLIVVVRAYQNNENGINFDLFLVCTIGALILPSVSIDYKLPLLSPVIALALSHNSRSVQKVRQVIVVMLLISISLAYSYTLFSFVQRPVLLASCFPLFMIILTAITLLNVIENRTFYHSESLNNSMTQ